MKKILIFLTYSFFIGSCVFAQNTNSTFKDSINLKSGELIYCKIDKVDSTTNTITFHNNKVNAYQEVAFIDIISFTKIQPESGVVVSESVIPIGSVTQLNQQYVNRSVNNTAGDQLIKFANQAQTGIVLMLFGSIITTGSFFIEPKDDGKNTAGNTVAVLGMGLSLTGYIIHTVSYSRARNAGELMKLSNSVSLNSTQEGVGLTVKIK